MYADGVKETTATTGTVASLALSAVAGFARFADVHAVGTPVVYSIQSGNNRECGIGTVGAGNTLVRVRATSKYEGGTYTKNPATFLSLSGTSDVFITVSAGSSEFGQSALLRAKSSVVKHVHSADGWTTSKVNYNMPAGYFFVFPYKLDVSGVVSKIGCITNNGNAGSSCRVGLYQQAADGSVGNLLMDSGVLITITGNTLYLGTVTQQHLQAGWYWAVVNSGATGPDLSAHGKGNGYIGLSGSDGTRFSIGLNFAPRTLAALPSDGSGFPSLTPELLGNVQSFPAIVLEIL